MAVKKPSLDIGEVAELTGMRPSTLRFYEEKGLIRPTSRKGLRRQYGACILQQLEFIALGQNAGLSLGEISVMFTSEGFLQVDRRVLVKKADDIGRNLRKLEAVRNTLLHVAKCSAANHMECPKFRRLLRVAGHVSRMKGKRRSHFKTRP